VNKEALAHWGMLRKKKWKLGMLRKKMEAWNVAQKKRKLHTQNSSYLFPSFLTYSILLSYRYFPRRFVIKHLEWIFFSRNVKDHVSPTRKTDSKITVLGPKSQRFVKKNERKQFSNVVVTTFPIRPVMISEWKI
jgi:hypothetical protein